MLATNGLLHDAMLEVIAVVPRSACSAADEVISTRDSRRQNAKRFGPLSGANSGIAPALTSCEGAHPMRRLIPARLRASAAIAGLIASIVAVVAVVLLVPSIASAQQSLNFSVGGFVPRRRGRPRCRRCAGQQPGFPRLRHQRLQRRDVRRRVAGRPRRQVRGRARRRLLPSRPCRQSTADFVNANGSEIEQDLKLRVVPFTATVRFLPLGHDNGIEPYIGARRRRAQLALQREPGSSSRPTARSSATTSSAAAPRPVR